jgi:hypothetical protein
MPLQSSHNFTCDDDDNNNAAATDDDRKYKETLMYIMDIKTGFSLRDGD